MRVRRLDDAGDMTFGQGSANFLIDSSACVAQNIKTRLELWTGEWFLDDREGMPWSTEVLGSGTKPIYDLAIKTRILETPGVTEIDDYTSQRGADRRLVVSGSVVTQFSADPIPFGPVTL